MSVFGKEVLTFGTGIDFSGMNSDLGGMGRKINSALGPAVKAFKAVAAVGAIVGGAVLAVGASVISTGAEFESLEARLSTLLGSAEAGAARMREVMEAAAKTPFELDELVQAEATLEGFGVNAQKWRPAVLDLAAAMGLDVVTAAESVGRAFAGGAGAADVLRDRGVLAMVELREGVKATDMSTQQFRDSLHDALTDPSGRIHGGTQRLAETFSGLVSNMKDRWSAFNKEVADAGSFAAVKEALKITLELISDNEEGIGDIARTISTVLVGALKLGIDGIAFMAEGWTGVKALTFGFLGGLMQAGIVLTDLDLAVIDLARSLEKIPIIGDTIGEGLDAMEESLLGQREEYVGMLAEMDKEAGKIADEFGTAAAGAQEMKDRIDEAVDAAITFNSQEFGAGVGDSPNSDSAGSGKDDGSADKLEKLIEQQAKFVGQLTTAGDDLAALQFQEEQALLKLADFRDKELALVGDNVEQQLDIWRRYHTDRIALQEEFNERGLQLQREAFMDSANHAHDFASTILDSFSAISDVGLEAASEKSEEAAMRIFRVQKGLAIAEIGINTIRAAIAALLPPPIGFGPVAGGIAAGVIAAGGIASIASVAATKPSFHSGGSLATRYAPSTLAPDEMDATLTRREAVLDETQQRGMMRMLRSAGAAAGGGPGGGPRVVVRYRHREFNEVVSDNLRINGSPLSSALDKGSVTSQR